jgi:hypothetical protein
MGRAMGQYKSDTLHNLGSQLHSDTLSLIPCITVVNMIIDTIDDMTLTPLSLSQRAVSIQTPQRNAIQQLYSQIQNVKPLSLRSRHDESRIQSSRKVPEGQARVETRAHDPRLVPGNGEYPPASRARQIKQQMTGLPIPHLLSTISTRTHRQHQPPLRLYEIHQANELKR